LATNDSKLDVIEMVTFIPARDFAASVRFYGELFAVLADRHAMSDPGWPEQISDSGFLSGRLREQFDVSVAR
jgi:predicted enzyme related to lactoylglutathione lyase